jgi:hypothetical protein
VGVLAKKHEKIWKKIISKRENLKKVEKSGVGEKCKINYAYKKSLKTTGLFPSRSKL